MSADPAAPMTLRLLGSFEAYVHGVPLRRLRAQPGYWLRARRARRAGAAGDRAWLAGTLWAESPDATAAENLRTYLKDLRRALGPEAGRLRSVTAHTLSLDLAGAAVDVAAFDQAIARGDLVSLQEAVGLYRGPLLEGCGEEWAFQERQARDQTYLQALEALAAGALAEDHPAAAELYLRRAVVVDPLRERAQRALMQVLAAGGNYAAALLCYRELRLLLHRELNTALDAETQTLFQQLRSEGRRLAAKGEGVKGRGGEGVRGSASALPARSFTPSPLHPLPSPSCRRPCCGTRWPGRPWSGGRPSWRRWSGGSPPPSGATGAWCCSRANRASARRGWRPRRAPGRGSAEFGC